MKRVLLVVPTEAREMANNLAASFAITAATIPDFSVPITSDGETITHFACCPDPGPELTAALPDLMSQVQGSDYLLTEEWSLDNAQEWLGEKGLGILKETADS